MTPEFKRFVWPLAIRARHVAGSLIFYCKSLSGKVAPCTATRSCDWIGTFQRVQHRFERLQPCRATWGPSYTAKTKTRPPCSDGGICQGCVLLGFVLGPGPSETREIFPVPGLNFPGKEFQGREGREKRTAQTEIKIKFQEGKSRILMEKHEISQEESDNPGEEMEILREKHQFQGGEGLFLGPFGPFPSGEKHFSEIRGRAFLGNPGKGFSQSPGNSRVPDRVSRSRLCAPGSREVPAGHNPRN